jgi:hypothetical protein
MDIKFDGYSKPFGIIGFVLSCFHLVLSFIPCIGYYAIGPAIISGVFCAVALVDKKNTGSTGIPLAGIILSICAIGMGSYQYYNYKEVFKAKAKIENAFDSVMTKMMIDTLESKLNEVDTVYEERDSTEQW